MLHEFDIIVACTTKIGGIGYNGDIPWYIRDDMVHFRKITSLAPSGKTNAVIMGRLTWNSLPSKPLKNRVNIVVTSKHDMDVDLFLRVASSLDDALQQASNIPNIHKIFIIGGGKLYQDAIQHDLCNRVYVTYITPATFIPFDTFFPLEYMHSNFTKENESSTYNNGDIQYTFVTYIKN